MEKKDYTGFESCDKCHGDLEEVNQYAETNSYIFIMQCNHCGKMFKVTSKHYIEELEGELK